MWRVALSIAALVFNVLTFGFALLLGLGFAINVAQGQAQGTGSWLLFALVASVGVGSLVSIAALGFGARLRGRTAPPSPTQVAAEFS